VKCFFDVAPFFPSRARNEDSIGCRQTLPYRIMEGLPVIQEYLRSTSPFFGQFPLCRFSYSQARMIVLTAIEYFFNHRIKTPQLPLP
jgi:hypothetical protein